MKTICLPRCQGKTTRLIYASNFNDAVIVCTDPNRKKNIMSMAQNLGLEIPEPITISNLLSDAKTDRSLKYSNFLIDDTQDTLTKLFNCLGLQGSILGIAVNQY